MGKQVEALRNIERLKTAGVILPSEVEEYEKAVIKEDIAPEIKVVNIKQSFWVSTAGNVSQAVIKKYIQEQTNAKNKHNSTKTK